MFNARLSVGIDYTPIAGLKFATSASGDAYFSNNHVFRPSYLNSNNLSSVEASRSMVAMIQWETSSPTASTCVTVTTSTSWQG